jgi:hypothetical protein
MNQKFIFILTLILILGSFYFWKNFKKEGFNNITGNTCPISMKDIETTHHPVYVYNKNNKNDTVYQIFSNDDFSKLYDDEIPKYRALRKTSDSYQQNNRIHMLDMTIKAQSTSSFKNSIRIILKSFDNNTLIEVVYDFKDKKCYLVDYTNSSSNPEVKSWTSETIEENNKVAYLGLRSRINNMGKWKDHIWIDNKCFTLNNFDYLVNQFGFAEMISDASSSFMPEIQTYYALLDPITPPKIQSIRTLEKEMLPGNIRPRSSVAYRPKTSQEGYYSLGEYLHRDDMFKDQPLEPLLMLKKGDYVKTPPSITWVWDNVGGKDQRDKKTVYRQNNFSEGSNTFMCLGDYAGSGWLPNRGLKTSIPTDAKTHPHVCVRSDCLEIQSDGKYEFMYNDKGSGARQDGSSWSNYYRGSSTHLDTINKIGYPGHYLMSFKNGHGDFARDKIEINRRANIKAECLTPDLPSDLDKEPINASIDSNFNLEKTKYDQNKMMGLNVVRGENNSAKLTANQTLVDNLALVENKEDSFVKTSAHNTEMNNRKNQYISRTVFLNELKNKLTNTSKNQEDITLTTKNIQKNIDVYNKTLNSNKNMMNDINNKLKEEAKKSIEYTNYKLGLKAFEAKKPNNPAILFT